MPDLRKHSLADLMIKRVSPRFEPGLFSTPITDASRNGLSSYCEPAGSRSGTLATKLFPKPASLTKPASPPTVGGLRFRWCSARSVNNLTSSAVRLFCYYLFAKSLGIAFWHSCRQ